MIEKVKVKIFNKSQHPIPVIGSEHAAAVDVRADLTGMTISDLNYSYNVFQDEPNSFALGCEGGRMLVPTGIHLAIPEGYAIFVMPRSGLALKHGISIVNTPGLIDSDYRGEVGIILINHGHEEFVIKDGDRIAQLCLRKVETIEWDEVESINQLGQTDRGEGGFGSTGK